MPLLLNTNIQSEAGHDIISFLAENIYLLIGLLVGIIVAIVMRNTLKTKP